MTEPNVLAAQLIAALTIVLVGGIILAALLWSLRS